jgi:two-component system, OmpR family, phosphate regulon sensor histidine kinase PhoR
MQSQSPEAVERRLLTVQALLANVPDPIILVGSDGLVREANAAARALLPTLRPGQPLSYGLRTPDILDAVAAPSADPVHVEYRTRMPAERIFDVQITALPPRGEKDARGPEVMLFFRDLTQARRLERMRVDFVANASHELRTPLASLIGFIETLQRPAREDPAAQERFLEIMHAQAWRMSRLIDDLLSLSRIELREHLAPNTPVDLRPLVAQMADTLTPLARDRRVEIVFTGGDGPAIVLGEADELLRVVENLVENAVKYGESGGRVDITLARHDGEVELAVRDYGAGIAPEHLPRLTERFYRVDVAESRDKGGTGLGLAIVKHIVNRHRGRLAIESEPGQGAMFTVAIPAAPVSPAPPDNIDWRTVT